MKALVLDPDTSGHGNSVRGYFEDTLAFHGIDNWTVDVLPLLPGDGAQHAVDNNYNLIIRSQVPDSGDELAWQLAWDNYILWFQAHGSNSNVNRDFPSFGQGGVIAVGGEDPTTPEDETSFGPGLEVDGQAIDGSFQQSWTTPTVAAVGAALFEKKTNSNRTNWGRWWEVRALLHQMGGETWSEQTGYGVVQGDQTLADGPAPVQAPFGVVATDNGDGSVTLECVDFKSEAFDKTIWLTGSGAVIGEGSPVTYLSGEETTQTFRAFSQDDGGGLSSETAFSVEGLSGLGQFEVEVFFEIERAENFEDILLTVNPVDGVNSYQFEKEEDAIGGGAISLPIIEGTEQEDQLQPTTNARYRVQPITNYGTSLSPSPWKYTAGRIIPVAVPADI